MKKLIVMIIALIPLTVNAQYWEFGLGGGVSQNGAPSSNMYYKADQSTINYAASTKLAYVFHYGFKVGLQANVSELSGTSSTTYTSIYGGTIGGDDKRFVYSKVTTALCLTVNKSFFIGRHELYLGAAAGWGVGRNSHSHTENESYIAPDGGNGFTYGGQIGYVFNLNDQWGLNIEVAPRMYTLKYDAEAPLIAPHEELNYTILAYPVTVGIHYRFPYNIVSNMERFNFRRED
ncbi:MAG: hypothetical protein H0X33_06010 [Taibaiella sp.]|nr:hypothetical protein [Taibaiella sp.]